MADTNTRAEELRKWQRASAARLRARHRAELEADARFFTAALEALASGRAATVPTQLDADTRHALASETPQRQLLLVRGAEYWLEFADGDASVATVGHTSAAGHAKRLGAGELCAGDGVVAADDEHFVVQAGGRFWELDYDLHKRILHPFPSQFPLRGTYINGFFSFYALGSEYLELAGGRVIRFQRPMAFDCSAMCPVSAQGATPEDALVVVAGRPQRWHLTHWRGSPVRFLPYEGALVAIYGGVTYYFLNPLNYV